MSVKKCIVLFIILFASLAYRADTGQDNIINDYIKTALDGNWPAAEEFWHPELIARSNALGITFDSIPAKFDCASNLFHSIDAIKSGHVKIDTTIIEQYPDYTEIQLWLTGASDTASDFYYIVPVNNGWKIVPRYYIHSQNWRMVRTRFTNIYYNNESLINNYALKSTDEFILDLCNLLQISKSRLEQLEQVKIDYYLCTEDEMELLTGYRAHGLTNFQFDAVITRHLPHQHELAHLLINYAFGDVPLYTLPVFQEGFAVSAGGRWGKTPDVLMQLGFVLMNQGFIKIDDLLGWDDFYNKAGPADLTYPVSGIFSRFILENYSMNIYKKLYQEFSASDGSLKLLTAPKIKRQITEICESPWNQIESAFNAYLDSFKSSGIDPGGDIPNAPPLMTLNSKDLKAQIWDGSDNYLFKITCSGDNPDGVLLMNPEKPLNQKNYESWMFSEQISEADYNAERFGLVFNTKEVGLYDYYNNILQAKYVKAFLPSRDYSSNENKTIIFRLAKNKLGHDLNQYKLRLISK